MAFRIGADVIGDMRFKKKLKSLSTRAQSEMERALVKSTLDLHREAVLSIKKRSSGKQVIRYRPRRRVTVSRPGDAPNTDRGGLISSVAFNINKIALRSEVGSNLKYARWLEQGTKRMRARPWLGPAYKKHALRFKKAFRKAARNIGKSN